MTERPDLSVVIPTYNERDQVASLVDQLFASCAMHGVSAEVIIVDDNSPDGTGDFAERLARTLAMRVIHRPSKLGLGSAVIDGIGAAAGDIVCVMDADLSHPPALVPALYAVLKSRDVDMVVASRYVAGGGTRSWPARRRRLSRLACCAVRPLTPVHDAMSGFFLVRRDLFCAVPRSFRGFKIGLELLVRSSPRSVAEIPYVFVGRVAGSSKMTVGELIRSLWQLLALYRFSCREPRRRPHHQVIVCEHAVTS